MCFYVCVVSRKHPSSLLTWQSGFCQMNLNTMSLPTPRCCIKHNRFESDQGWRLMQITTNQSETIAVSGRNVNTFETFTDVFVLRYCDSNAASNLLYSRQFEEYVSEGKQYWYRYASVLNAHCSLIVTSIGDKLEIIGTTEDKVLAYRPLNGEARCMAVTEKEIYIGFKESNRVMVYDSTLLHEIRSVILRGIQDGLDGPFDLSVTSDKLFVCIGRDSPESYHRSLVFQEANGTILSELTHTSRSRFYAYSITADVKSGIVAVVWLEKYFLGGVTKIVFYSLNENIAFLTAEIESCFLRIRISDGADKMIIGNHMTGEVNVYDMAELFTYDHLKKQIATSLKTDDFVKLTNFLSLPKQKTDTILGSDSPVENLLCVLEEMSVIEPPNVDRLTEAFRELKMTCSHLTEIYQNTRTSYYYKDTIKSLREELNKLHDENRWMKNKLVKLVDADSKMQNLHVLCRENEDMLRKAGIQLHERNLRSTYKPAQLQQCLLQLLNFQRQTQLVTQSCGKTDKSLIQPKTVLLNELQTKRSISADHDHSQSPFYHPATELKGTYESEGLAENETDVSDLSSFTHDSVPSSSDGHLQSSLDDDFAKFLVKVSVKLTNTNCLLLAHYFNFPASKIDLVQKDSETPGLTLFRIMKERSIINMNDVSSLQQALVDLGLNEINDTLVNPYQKRIDT